MSNENNYRVESFFLDNQNVNHLDELQNEDIRTQMETKKQFNESYLTNIFYFTTDFM